MMCHSSNISTVENSQEDFMRTNIRVASLACQEHKRPRNNIRTSFLIKKYIFWYKLMIIATIEKDYAKDIDHQLEQ
jgi:hypothetical protein